MIAGRPVLCLVTDRRRLAARLGLGADQEPGAALCAQIREATRSGVSWVQVREPDLAAGALTDLVRAILRETAGTGARVLVNDRVDVALAAGADGVHLKASSMPAAAVRAMVPPGWLIGQSVHGVEPLARADREALDYLICGAIFATGSKPAGWPVLGISGLRAVIAAAGALPVLAIGGVGPSTAGHVALAGAYGVAAIDAFLPGDPDEGRETVQEKARRLRIAFDSPAPVT